MHMTLHPLPSVGPAITPQEQALTLQDILNKFSGVACTTLPLEGPMTVLLSVREVPTVLALIYKTLVADAMLSALHPHALVARAVRFGQLALTMCCAANPAPIVHSAIRPTLRACAMWLPILSGLSGIDSALWNWHVLYLFCHVGSPRVVLCPAGVVSGGAFEEMMHHVLLLVDVSPHPTGIPMPANALAQAGQARGLAWRCYDWHTALLSHTVGIRRQAAPWQSQSYS
mmetsp:Transcript_137286/g.256351  ORF Transcript_137286/g.256351 Transcript_137286/m.256351 type:complete len:229 (+) Transcript_137286:437-1123(+)